MRDYARRLVSVAAEHGRIVFWADGHWGRNLWLDVGLDRDLMSAIQTHPGHFVPLWKMNCSLTPFSIHSAVLGFWLSRAVDNWGVQPERWYWYEAGFRKLGRQAWFKQGTMEDFPPAFYGQMILLGLASGASVYSFEPGGDTWNQAGGASAISRQVVFPFLSFILERGLVPERAEILKKVCCAYVAEKEDSAWALDYSTLKESYKALYGIAHPFQMIPTSSRFYLLPILSRWTPAAILESFPGRWDRRRSADPKVGRSRALRKPAERFRGDAWVVSLPRAVLAMNSRENKDVDQSFDLEFAGAIRRLRGDLSVNSYFVGLDSGGEFRGLLNGRAGKSVTLTMWCRAQPKEIHVAPEASLKKSLWLESKNRLILIFSLAQETIDVKLSFAGNQAGGGEVGIDFPADSNSGGGLTTERRKNA